MIVIELGRLGIIVIEAKKLADEAVSDLYMQTKQNIKFFESLYEFYAISTKRQSNM